MYRRMINVVLFLISSLFMLCSTNLVYSQANPQGKGEHKGWSEGKRAGQKSETPPGWKKGLKKGWETSTPPGWNKWDKKEKKRWKKDLARAKKEINARAKKKGWGVEDKEKAIIALEFTVRRGVPVKHAKKVIRECIGHGLKGEDTLRVGVTLSEGVDKGVNFETLGSKVVKKLKAGYRGEKLAKEIYFEIEKRYKAKMEAQEKKVGKPVGRDKPKPGKKEEKLEKREKKKKNIEKPEKGSKGKRKSRAPGRSSGGRGRGGRGK